MASTSTSRRSSTGAPIVKLPSIHEMFPEHLAPRAASARPRSSRAIANVVNHSPRNQFVPPPAPAPPPPPPVYPSFSFEVLKSDPRSSSLEHIASSRPGAPPRRSVPRSGSSPILRAHAPAALIAASEGDAEMDVDGDEGEDGEGFEFAEEGKKHICPTCSKRFNRPSSLRIHVNTHTGATPFRCPHPSCGRAFNVNSNMRRHFRNHANDSPTSPSASPSSLSYNKHPPGPPVVTSFTSPTSPSLSSPPSASWSSSSRSSFASPITPASATFPPPRNNNDSVFAADRWTLVSVPPTWNRRDGKHAQAQAQYESFSQTRHTGYGYSESDVRSDRPR